MPDKSNIQIRTPEGDQQQLNQKVSDNIVQFSGQTVNTTPTTAATPVNIKGVDEGDSLGQMLDRTGVFVGHNPWPGSEPSKSFLKKLIERIRRKNPGSPITAVKK